MGMCLGITVIKDGVKVADSWDHFGDYTTQAFYECSEVVKNYFNNKEHGYSDTVSIVAALSRATNMKVNYNDWQRMLEEPEHFNIKEHEAEFIAHNPAPPDIDEPDDPDDDLGWQDYDDAWDEYDREVRDYRECIWVHPDEHGKDADRWFQFSCVVDFDREVIDFGCLWFEEIDEEDDEEELDILPDEFVHVPFDKIDEAMEFWEKDYIRCHGKPKEGTSFSEEGRPLEYEIEPEHTMGSWRYSGKDGEEVIAVSTNGA